MGSGGGEGPMQYLRYELCKFVVITYMDDGTYIQIYTNNDNSNSKPYAYAAQYI